MYYSYVEIEYVATSFSSARMDLAVKLLIKLAGAAVAYKYKTQLRDTIATSSTESEFMAAYELGKMLLYVRSILWDLNVPQEAISQLYEDNYACTAMANAQKPTSRTRHMDIR
jgi:hypothetical protein